MWFADVGAPLGWGLLATWLVATVLTVCSHRVRRTLPRPRLLLAGVGVAAALFAAQAGVVDLVEDHRGPGPLDRSVLAWVLAHRSPALTSAMRAASTIGSTAAMAVLAVLAAAMLWRARHRAVAGVVLGAAAGAGLLVEGFKHLYGRSRPPVADQLVTESSFSLPSGHALGSIVVLGVLAAAVALLARRRGTRIAAITLSAAGTGTIGVSRIYLGVHWASDVLTGWLLGAAWLAACLTALALCTTRALRLPASASDRPRGDRDGADLSAAHR